MSRAYLLIAIAAGLLACGDDNPTFGDGGGGATSTTGGGGTGGDGGTASGTGGTASGVGAGGMAACVDFGEPCSACELVACEDRYCECYGNADCGLYASCVIDCASGDTQCLQDCNTAYPDGITDAVLLNDCAATSCPQQCAAFDLYELDPCETCLYENCETAMNGCLAVPDCTALLFCIAECGDDMGCQNGCAATYPGGIEKATPVGSCSNQNCGSECGG